MTCWTTYSL